MRLPFSRATALVAIIAAVVTASGIATARSGSSNRDRALRATRAGLQRLETPDGPLHSHEETEAVSGPAGQMVGGTARAAAPPGSRLDPHAPVSVLPSPFVSFFRSPFHVSPVHLCPPPTGRGLDRQAAERAPPAA